MNPNLSEYQYIDGEFIFTPKPIAKIPSITEDQKAIDMMKYLMQSDDFLKMIGIAPITQ